MRTFIAISLDNEIKNHLEQLIAKLKACQCHVRWVNANGMHLTLKFLGDVSSEKIPEISKVMDLVCEGYQAFPLELGGTGTFPPSSKKPRVVWVGVKSNDSLFSLQKELEDELSEIDFPKEKRTYSPHLTLGRIKSSQDMSLLLSLLESERESGFGRMQVNVLTLFESTLKPTGAEYTKVNTSRLL